MSASIKKEIAGLSVVSKANRMFMQDFIAKVKFLWSSINVQIGFDKASHLQNKWTAINLEGLATPARNILFNDFSFLRIFPTFLQETYFLLARHLTTSRERHFLLIVRNGVV